MTKSIPLTEKHLEKAIKVLKNMPKPEIKVEMIGIFEHSDGGDLPLRLIRIKKKKYAQYFSFNKNKWITMSN